ncbi:MAG: hypothetical protein QOH93_3624 [Chloroflexia bacterium]|nr:hypothetical protein [Chloroflexia bacterium]
MKRLAFVGTGLLLMLTLMASWPAAPAAACECPDGARLPQDQFAKAEAVFTGKVIAGPGDPHTGGEGALLEVLTVWKGGSSKATQVVDAPFCNLDAKSYYQMGETYLIYGAHSVYGIATANFLSPLPCGRTGPLAQASADLAFLGKGLKVAESTGEPLPASGRADQGLVNSLFVLVTLCLGMGLTLVAWGKKRLS